MWQPIETAPKDGTMILALLDDHTDVPVVVHWYRYKDENETFEYWRFSDEIFCENGDSEAHPVKWCECPKVE